MSDVEALIYKKFIINLIEDEWLENSFTIAQCSGEAAVAVPRGQ